MFEGDKKQSPLYSFKERTKYSAHREHSLEFLGKDSPGIGKYNNEAANKKFQSLSFSVGKGDRFIPEYDKHIAHTVPHHYCTLEGKSRNKYTGVHIGYGNKFSLKTSKDDETTPAAIYSNDLVTSIAYKNIVEPKKDSSFGQTYDKYSNICYKGMEKAF